MTWALWGVALVSCKVWHLVPWLAEHVGWGGTQSHPCSVGPVQEPWMTLSSVLPLRWTHADPHHYWSASIAINLLNNVLNEAFSEPKTDTFPAIVESNGEAEDSSVKGIMDHYCLVQGTWHGHHAARVLQSTRVKGILTAYCVLWAKWNSCHLTRIKREKY